MFAVDTGNNLLTFDSSTPGTINSSILISGLGVNEEVQGIDTRPATGQLYALGITDDGPTRTGRIYRLNPTTGAATAVGPAFSNSLNDSISWEIDFNPVVDRIRVVNGLRQTCESNPMMGLWLGQIPT